MTCVSLTRRPTLEDVKRLLGDQSEMVTDGGQLICGINQINKIYESQMHNLEHRVQPVAYIARLTADGTFADQNITSGQDLLVIVLTLGNAGEDEVRRLCGQGEHLWALVTDALLNAWLFAADLEVQERVKDWCLSKNLGVCARMEPFVQLPGWAQQWICDQLQQEPGFGVRLTAGGMLEPEKSMCYLLLLDKDVTRFAAGHDCRNCSRGCAMRDSGQPCNSIRKEPHIMQDERIQILVEDQGKKIVCAAGQPLLPVLQEHGIRVNAPCGGSGRCGKCRIRVVGGELPPTQTDQRYLSGRELASGVRLACVARPDSNLRIRILAKAEQRMDTCSSVNGHPAPKHASPALFQKDPAGYKVAVDIGTTTLAACLYGCTAGTVYEQYTVTAVNRGRDFGADVLSRMEASVNGKRTRLKELLQEDICDLLKNLCVQTGVSKTEIHQVVIAANMTMVHLLMGYSCETLGRSPFVPVNAGLIRADALQILGDAGYDCPVEILPAVSAFVGGDIVSGMLALGMDRGSETTLLLDVGTNGEMALRHGETIYVTSTAAGPAFEGGDISCGCASIPGAVSSVQLRKTDHTPCLQTIADAPPVGICGSGVLELVSELRMHGIIDETGLFLSEDHWLHGFALAKSADGTTIRFTQADIRAFQLAKGAIRAGIETLLSAAGVQADAVSQVYLAGGFGVRMDEHAAIAVGLLPEQLACHIRAVGNSSLSGAVYAGMHEPVDEQCQRLLAQCRQIVLADQPEFEERYLRYINL